MTVLLAATTIIPIAAWFLYDDGGYLEEMEEFELGSARGGAEPLKPWEVK